MAGAVSISMVGSYFSRMKSERGAKAYLREYLGHYLICVPENRKLLKIVGDTTDLRLAKAMIRSLKTRK